MISLRFFIFLVATLLTQNIFSQNIDIDLLQKINNEPSEFWRGYSKSVSNTVTYVSLGSTLSIATVGLIKNDKKLLYDALYLGVNLGVNASFTYGLKNAVRRSRPGISYPEKITMYEQVSSLSFPSGHTSEAFGTATALSLTYPHWYIIAPAYLWAGSVAYSRLNLGVHYPSDVLGGAILGASTAFLTYKVNDWLHQKFELKNTNDLQIKCAELSKL